MELQGGSEVEFCEGQLVILDNNTTDVFDFFVIDWADGSPLDTVQAGNNPQHLYTLTDDQACSGGSSFFIFITGYFNCIEGLSCHTIGISLGIEPGPRSNFSAPNQVCLNEPVDFNSTSCNVGTYVWDFGDGSPTSSLENPTHIFTEAGTYQVTLEVFGEDECGNISDTYTENIEVIMLPEANFAQAGETITICQNEELDFSAITNSFTNLDWSITPSPGADSTVWCYTDPDMMDSDQDITVRFKQVGTYTVTLEGSNICGSETVSAEIEVLSAPVITLEETLEDCDEVIANIANLNYSISGTYSSVEWCFTGSNNDGCVTVEDFGSRVFTQNGTITLTVISPCNLTGITREVEVTVQSSEPVVLMGPDELCTGSEPDTLTASVPGGDWSGPCIDSEGILDPNASCVGLQTYTYTYGDGLCPGQSADIQVQINISENLSLTPARVCENGDPIQLSASITGGTWIGANTTVSGIFDPSGLAPGFYPVFYQVDDANQCRVSQTLQVHVSALPVLNTVDTAVACLVDQQVDLEDISGVSADSTGGVYTWTVNGDPFPSGQINPLQDLGAPGIYPIDI
ncbi:MAG: PKD domain-containing protein, partial [Bacteroidota bacterium]